MKLGPIKIISCLSSDNFKKLERGGGFFFFFLKFQNYFFLSEITTRCVWEKKKRYT